MKLKKSLFEDDYSVAQCPARLHELTRWNLGWNMPQMQDWSLVLSTSDQNMKAAGIVDFQVHKQNTVNSYYEL